MFKSIAALILSAALATSCATTQRAGALRLDASSAETAEDSYQAMMKGRSEAEQQRLALAVAMLNFEGVKSVFDVVGNPELDSLSIAPVRDKVAGMTAEQIIERANKNPSVRIEAAGQ